MTTATQRVKANGHQLQHEYITARNPASGEVIGQVRVATPEDIWQARETARLGQIAWEGIGLQRRLAFVRGLRDALYRNQERILNTFRVETGKIYAEAQNELLASLELCTFYLNASERALAPRDVNVFLLPHRAHRVERRPFGVVLVISPWNFPLWLSIGPIVTALIAGNSVIFKPSEYATQMGDLIAFLMAEAGVPPEVFQTLHGRGDIGAALIQTRPDKICFTGSVATGRKVAQAAAEYLIPVTLELGGKDIAIVLDDANLRRAAQGVVWAGMFNAGQACASLEVAMVQRTVVDRFVAAMRDVVQREITSWPEARASRRPPTLGAITTPFQLKIIESQVSEAVAGGATVITGGCREGEIGQFYAPTILTNVTPQMRVVAEETFGPVIAVMPFDDLQEAVHTVNESRYGLTASVWTRNRRRGLSLLRQLKVGQASLNEHFLASGVVDVPWGGVRDSGYGRTQGEEGLLEMTYTVAVNWDRLRIPRALEIFWYPYNSFKRQVIQRLINLRYGPRLADRLRALLPW